MYISNYYLNLVESADKKQKYEPSYIEREIDLKIDLIIIYRKEKYKLQT